MKNLLSYFIITATLVSSCTFTKTKVIEPAFTLTLDSIAREINSLIITPETSITGKEISTNGHKTTELTINLFNSKNLPNDEAEQRELAQNIAILTRNTLKNPNSFTDYKVLFTKKAVNGAVTKSSYVGYSYNSRDLKNYIQIVSVGNQFDSSVSEAVGRSTFNTNDSKIIACLKYYNNVAGSPVKLNMYKNTDSGLLLLTSRNQGQIITGNKYLVNELKIADLYKIKELGQGTYKIEYTVSDTAVGSKDFVLE